MRMFSRRRPAHDPAHDLYAAIVAQARRPEFYLRCGVADSVAGRFDMVTLHAYLVLRRLKGEGAAGAALAQAVFDLMFAEFDVSVRELGVGDLRVGKRVKDLARAFYGRIAAYEEGLAADGAALEDALRRNLYRGEAPEPGRVAAMARYVRRQAEDLARRPAAELLAGRVSFGSPPSRSEAA